MGHGIAEVSAIAGYDVVLRDIEDEYVQNGYDQLEWSVKKLAEKGQLSDSPEEILARVETTTDLEAAVSGADIVIEAAPENLGLKRDIFSEVEAFASDETIIATNTSSLRVSDIAAEVALPRRCCGLHFFNPPVKMDLVEVVYGEKTTEDVAETAYEFAESLDKTPIYVQKDVPEFVVNNVLTPFMEEAGWMLDDGTATVESVDATMVYERGYPMGPCELNDFGGLDILAHTRDQWDRPIPESIRDRVEADKLGRKTGAGFYDYDDGPGVDYGPEDLAGVDSLRIEARMINAAAKLVGDGVATPEDIDIGMRLGGGLPEGTCRTADKIGLDAVLEKLESLYSETGADRYAPADYLVELVEDGNTGEAAGQGFYDYSGDGPYFYLDHEIDDRGVLSVTLDRQERLNAFNDDMFAEVERLMTTADVDDVRCVVFEGAGGKAFSSGADVTAFTTTDPISMMDIDQTMVAVAEFERPTIAKIDGYCFGAGLELSLACDFRVASDGSSFASPEIDLGLIPGGGGTQRLVRTVGEPLAKEMIFRGTHLSASEAETADLLNEAVPEDELDDTIESYVSDFVRGPPTALKVAKRIIDKGQDVDLESGLSLEKQGFSLLITTDDMVEGVTAFREDREPEFTGE
ncbi:3-hydroxyacyl-CoA dehydrogenase [Haloferax volcanii DS2]|nr:3-hydroxyacyl-CoA dehydrogenase [Haloferax volcanii DS2]